MYFSFKSLSYHLSDLVIGKVSLDLSRWFSKLSKDNINTMRSTLCIKFVGQSVSQIMNLKMGDSLQLEDRIQKNYITHHTWNLV